MYQNETCEREYGVFLLKKPRSFYNKKDMTLFLRFILRLAEKRVVKIFEEDLWSVSRSAISSPSLRLDTSKGGVP